MTRDTRRQPNKQGQQRMRGRDQSGSYMRSPALESAEERRSAVSQVGVSRKGANSRGRNKSRSYARFAADELLLNPGIPRKRLPRLGTKRVVLDSGRAGSDNRQHHTGLTADWRMQPMRTPPLNKPNDSSQEERRGKKAIALQGLLFQAYFGCHTTALLLPNVTRN